MATNGSFAHQEQYKAAAPEYAAPAAIDPAGEDTANNDLSKDEVGWYFVEQYYTTLSKSPEKLHLFYGKRSQFVSGIETEVANVSVGRQAIQDRIKQLDFQECKVRVSNVDSQATFDNIVIQVIGEISNKNGEPKKFVQTFVLAQQPSGYFVLNDILRYIDEEGDEAQAETGAESSKEPKEETAPTLEVEPEQAPEVVEDAPKDLDTKVIEEKLEDATVEDTNGDAPQVQVEAADAQPEAPTTSDPEVAAQELAEEDAKEVEKPKDPAPTPISKPDVAPAEPVAAEPAAAPRPMTWASRAAAAAGPRPVVPLAKTATPPAQSQNRAPAPAAATTPTTSSSAAATTSTPAAASSQPAAPVAATEPVAKDSAGWQSVGADSKRHNRPQSISAAPADKEGTLGYVKYVTDKVQEADLRSALAAHGELAYFDINRQKNCAFVEYKTLDGYHAALNANPHIVNGEQIVVEQRRPKTQGQGANNFGRGGSQRGRGGFDGNRTGGGNRGNFSGQNRGRGGARGRGSSQAANI